MDYSDDRIMTTFSPGQARRMQAVLLNYKPQWCAAQAAGYCEQPPPSPPPLPPSATPAPAPLFFTF